MVPYDAGDHFDQIFQLYFDAGDRSLLIGDRLENCWLATSNSCIHCLLCFLFSTVLLLLRHKRSHLFAFAESCLFYLLVDVVPTASCESVYDIDCSICR